MAASVPVFGTVLLIVSLVALAIVPAVALVHRLYFVVLPKRTVMKYAKTDPDRLRLYMERVVATPSLLGPGQKNFARGALVNIYLPNERHDQAAAHCRAILDSLARSRNPQRHAALEADIRRKLADCHERLGDMSEASKERHRAAESVDRAAPDALKYVAQGTLLERQNRHEEAYAAFQRALEFSPPRETTARLECMMRLILTANRAGRPLDCLRWADEVIASGATGSYLRIAHTMAGTACGNLSRLDESEQHCRQAYDLAAAQNNTSDMADTLASLAGCLRKRGKLLEANEACTKAAAMDPTGLAKSLPAQALILRTWGRYDDALKAQARFKEVGRFVTTARDRQLLAAWALATARIEAESGRADDAWQHIQEALAVLRDDAKLGLTCEAAMSWVLAARGLAHESQRLAIELEPRLAAFQRDPSTCRNVLYDLGMASVTRGDHSAGIGCWTRYLALDPDPVSLPSAHYHRGECHYCLGDVAQAREDYHAAVALNLDTHHTQLARQRIGFRGHHTQL